MSTITTNTQHSGHRAQILAEAVVSAYIHEIATYIHEIATTRHTRPPAGQQAGEAA